MFTESMGIWLAALLTLAIFSFLYKDNPFYKFAEHLFTGVSAAYWMCMAFWSQVHPNLFGNLWWPEGILRRWGEVSYIWVDEVVVDGVRYAGSALVDGSLTPDQIAHAQLVNQVNALYYVPLGLGLLFFTRLIPKLAYLSRWPLAFVMGMAAGLRLYVFLQSNALEQVGSTIAPVLGAESFATGLNNFIVLVGVFAGLVYFYFSREHKGVFGAVSRVGVYFLMLSFGAAFGYTVMARVSLLLGRFVSLRDWLTGIF